MDFSTLYLQLHPRLVSTLAAVSGEVDLAADVADEACARALPVEVVDTDGVVGVAVRLRHRDPGRGWCGHKELSWKKLENNSLEVSPTKHGPRRESPSPIAGYAGDRKTYRRPADDAD